MIHGEGGGAVVRYRRRRDDSYFFCLIGLSGTPNGPPALTGRKPKKGKRCQWKGVQARSDPVFSLVSFSSYDYAAFLTCRCSRTGSIIGQADWTEHDGHASVSPLENC